MSKPLARESESDLPALQPMQPQVQRRAGIAEPHPLVLAVVLDQGVQSSPVPWQETRSLQTKSLLVVSGQVINTSLASRAMDKTGGELVASMVTLNVANTSCVFPYKYSSKIEGGDPGLCGQKWKLKRTGRPRQP